MIKKVLVLAVILLLILVGVYFWVKKDSHPSIVVPNDSTKVEELLIDSLKKELIQRDSIIGCLKDSVVEIEVIRTEEVNKIKELPIDSSVWYLEQKLREYEVKY